MAKRALLVGINDYPGTQNDLQGCVNDITNVYDILVKYSVSRRRTLRCFRTSERQN